MAARKHEAISARPERIRGIVLELLVPQRISRWRQGHRRSRMATLGRLNGIHRECSNRVDRQLFDFRHVTLHGGLGQAAGWSLKGFTVRFRGTFVNAPEPADRPPRLH